MLQRILNSFDLIFPVRTESAGNPLAIWLDRAIYLFILLMTLAAPLSIAATTTAWLLGMTAWFVRALIKPRPKLLRSPLDLPLFALFGWCLLTCFFSYAPDLSFDRLRVLTLFPIAYLISQNVRSSKTIKFLVAALIFSCLATVVWTFTERAAGRGAQVFGVKPDSPLARAGVIDGDTLLKINGKKFRQPERLIEAINTNGSLKLQHCRLDWCFPETEIKSENLLAGETANARFGFETSRPDRNFRATGFYNHFTTYSEVLQLVLSLAFGIFIALPHKKSRLGAVLILCLIGIGAALLMTATRGSQIGFVLSTLAIIAVGANRKVLLGALILLVPVALVGAFVLQKSRNVGYIDRSDGSVSWRETVYREGFQLLIKSPRHLAVGVGIDSINRFRCEWGLFDSCRLPPGHFHSTPLQIAVECGLPALVLWLFVVFRYGKTLLRTIKIKTDWLERGVLLGAFGGLVGFFAGGVVHYNLGDSEVAMLFYLIMGFGLVLARNAGEEKSNSGENLP